MSGLVGGLLGLGGSILSSLFGGGGSSESRPQGPSPQEIAAQKREELAFKKKEQILSAKERGEVEEARGRGAIIRARRQGPQTLFTRPGTIPKPVTLGAGSQKTS